MHSLPVLLTRPRGDALRMAEDLRGIGADRVVVSPLLRIVPTGPLPELDGTILLTSANAVQTYVDLGGRAGLPAWCVGPRTASLASAAGFAVAGHARDVDHLLEVVPGKAAPFLHLRGQATRGDLTRRLRAKGFAARDTVVYRQDAVPLSDAAIALLRSGPTLVPLYSPRTAEVFARACPADAVPHLVVLALSQAVADAAPVDARAVASSPDGAAMLALIQKHLHMIGG